MRTPPCAGAIWTSVPAKTRCRSPSTHKLARSGPNARNRSVESSQSNGSGSETKSDLVEVVEALVGNPSLVEIAGEAACCEDAVGRLGRAAVRVAVADVDDLVVARELLHDGALARLAAALAVLAVLPEHPPAVGPRVDPVGVQLDLDPLPLEDRLDELVEPGGDDDEPPPALLCERDQLVEPGPDVDVLELPADNLLERLPHGAKLARDDLAQGHGSPVETVLDLLVDRRVAEAARDRVEQVFPGDGAVEVDDER